MKERLQLLQKVKKFLKKGSKNLMRIEIQTPVLLGIISVLLVVASMRIMQLNKENTVLAQEQKILIQRVDNLAGAQDIVAEQLSLVVSSSQDDFTSLRSQTEERLIAARTEIENARLDLEDRLDAQSSELRRVIRAWTSRIPLVECTFSKEEENNMSSFSTTRGAGTLFISNGGQSLLTNRHVLEEEGEVLQTCSIIFSDAKEVYVFNPQALDVSLPLTIDFGRVTVEPSPLLKGRFAETREMCQQGAVIGDRIVVLGYPSIGAEKSITATEGIISGFDGDYFITSAKVERGNSGGAAILIRENCYLGIPTFTAAGRAESLARILDIRVIY
jgi:S1-C subfamily serine protease